MAALLTTTTTTTDPSSATISSTLLPYTASTPFHPGTCFVDNDYIDDVFDYISIPLGVFLIAENALIILIISRSPHLHTSTNILVASLALTDILLGVHTVLDSGFIHSLVRFDAHDWKLFTNVLTGLYISLVEVSIAHFAALAIDRYLFFLWPLRYTVRVTKGRVVLLACFLWATGVPYTIIPVVFSIDPRYREICFIFDTPFIHTRGPLIAAYLSSIVAIIASTVGIVRIALNHRRRREVARPPTRPNAPISRLSGSNNGYFKHDRIKPSGTNTIVDSFITRRNVQKTDSSYNVHRNDVGVSTVTSSDIGASIRRTAHNVTFLQVLSSDERSKPDTSQADVNLTINAAFKDIPGVEHLSRNPPNATNVECSIVEITEPPRSEDTDNEHETSGNDTRVSNHSYQISTQQSPPEKDKLFNKANTKILKFILVMTGSFLVCTLPSLTLIFLDSFFHGDPPARLMMAMHRVLIANSGFNFFILLYMNKDFRRALVTHVSCCKGSR